ncbi:cytochrome P450 [Meridianimarinicoccus roseus]|uniref:Cytochrome P450 n=1 Tax=Meridianimarinicoccus roseus TaxID=2072018 RepID=A0A2V2LMT0_9RHOB|nr:cytochrome P450 [Meridianimarinicoccus roseus]PWR04357.1 cytochrome P450 [Meridianimarinicoccus roseus]
MLRMLGNAVSGLGLRLTVLADGVGDGAAVALAGLRAVRAPGGAASNLPALAADPMRQRQGLAALRAFAPNLSLSRKLVAAYDNTGTVIVTRRADVMDVLRRDDDFEVVYGPRMQALTGGANFFLGMQPGWDYARDTAAMRLAMRHTDVADRIAPRAADLSARIVAEAGGRIDLPCALTRHVPWDMVAGYFGTPGPDPDTMQGWATRLFWYLFGDLGADPDLHAQAMEDAAGLREYLDGAIAARKSEGGGGDDLLGRCLALQAAGTPGMDDLGIRNNLLGLVIGAIPTISKAACLAADELLRRPDALRRAQAAARAGDTARLAGFLWEALRFNPHNPIIYRRAVRDTVIAPGTLRQVRVRKGQMVFAATLSAMFDRHEIDAPGQFRSQRPFTDHIIWGTGLHTCFGAVINAAVIPAILQPLLARDGLRRGEGAAGLIDTGGTPFPEHFTLLYDPG